MIKCPYCGREFDVQAAPTSATPAQAGTGAGAKPKWFFSDYWMIIALLCFGPFALHLVWRNPRYKPMTRLIVTVLVMVVTIVITIMLYYVIKSAYHTAMQQLGGLNLGY